MRKVRNVSVLLLVLVLIAGCAGLQASWNKLTPDEQGRVVLSGLQKQLDNGFDASKSFLSTNPKYQVDWKTKVVPAFDVANAAIKTAIIAKSTPDKVYAEILPLVNKALNLARGLGVNIK